MNINETIAVMLAEFPGWDWLVRSDDEEGAFANFHAPDIEDWTDGETCFPCWADTPENALSASLEWAKEARSGPGLLADSMLRAVEAKRRNARAGAIA